MTPKTAAAERAVIDAAKQIERAAAYGLSVATAGHQYDRARAAQARARQEERA